ncbi:MAG: tetratricopeptide repeat protein [Candidatus Neomarinimicrobiota bacterium]
MLKQNIYFKWILPILFFVVSSCSQKPEIKPPDTQVPTPSIEQNQSGNLPINPKALRHFMDGQLYLNQGDYAMAIVELQEALMLDPDVSTIYVSLSECYWYLEKPNRALSYLKKALELSPDDIDAREIMANQLVLRRLFDKAEEQYLILIESYPENAEYYFAMGELAKLQQKYEKALYYYRKTFELNPNVLEALELASEAAYNLQKYDVIFELTEQLLEYDETNTFYLRNFVDAAVRNRKYSDALAAVNRIMEIEGRTPQLLNQVGSIYYEMNESDLAEVIFLEVVAMDSVNVMGSHYLSTLFREKGEFENSIYYANRLIRFHSTDPRGFINKALSYIEKNDPKNAIETLHSVAQKFPGDFTIHYLLGMSYNQANFNDSARVYLERAIEIYPDSRGALHILAIIYDTSAEWIKSDQIYTHLISSDSSDAQALNNYAYSLAERGENLKLAREISKKAIIYEPNNPAYLDTYGWILYKLGKFFEANIYISKSLELDDINEIVLKHCGEVLMRLNREVEANICFEKAAALMRASSP